LQNTNLPTAEIAFLLGFEEPNSFFRAFRSWTGMTPEQFRQTSLLANFNMQP
jgi:AraC-like DNA-binding protein